MYDDILGPRPTKKSTNKTEKKPNLVKMNRDEINALQEDDNGEYWVKLVRLTQPKPTLSHRGKCKLHIQKRKDGDIGVLTPKHQTIPISWAEYCIEDIEENGDCIAEDYKMEIWKEVK